ncbi:VanZ family protein [Candidatus Woesearchaeota archaeon]|nr:VanZ family protein [Candidatus Woesearchaeota archaeon]
MSMKTSRFFGWYILPVITYCVFILYLSSVSPLLDASKEQGFDQKITEVSQEVISFKVYNLDNENPFNSYLKHLVEYFILGYLLFRLLQKTRYARYSFVMVILFGLLFGFLDETLQSFIPGRMVEWQDILADVLGTTLVVYVALLQEVFREVYSPVNGLKSARK